MDGVARFDRVGPGHCGDARRFDSCHHPHSALFDMIMGFSLSNV